MAAPAPKYDLMLLTDAKADEAARDKIRADMRAMIEAVGHAPEHRRATARASCAFEINKEGEAEYDLLQFEGPSTLLDQLTRTLHITDGVVRFRIIKVRPGTPDAPDLRQSADVDAPPEPVTAL